MGRRASKHDFEGGDGSVRRTLSLSGALVERPTHLYDGYRRYPYFAQRATWIKRHHPKVKTVLVAGCAYGYLVDELLKRKVDAWGCDASAYAVTKAHQILPDTVARRVYQADVGEADELEAAISGTGWRVDLVVTEDLLPCADDDTEARLWLENLRLVGTSVLHIVTPKSDHNAADLLWKTHAEWAAFCAPDRVLCTECMTVLG